MTQNTFNRYSDEELICLLRAGDNDVEDFLLSKYKPLVAINASSLYIEGGDRDDLIQEGMIGLFKAIREYSSDRGASFKTFAETCITRNMLTAITAAARKKHAVLNDSLSLNDIESSGDAVLSSDLNDPENILMQKEAEKSLLDRISSRLSPMESKILSLYLKGKSYKEIAGELGKTDKSVDNALQRIRRKVRSVL